MKFNVIIQVLKKANHKTKPQETTTLKIFSSQTFEIYYLGDRQQTGPNTTN